MNARDRSGVLLLVAGLLLCLVFALAFWGGEENLDHNVIVCDPDRTPVYFQALAALFPQYELREGKGQVFSYLERDAVVEAMDIQALPMLAEGLARYWYPHYLSTVVIAVDRDRSDARPAGWRELSSAGEPVAVLAKSFDLQRTVFAIAYGLEGEHYAVGAGIKFLKDLRKSGFLHTKDFDAPYLICYDYQAVALKKAGRNLEIIIPREGTLSYVSGLLSGVEVLMPEDMDERLIRAGLRLADGRCDGDFYPPAPAYIRAAPIPDAYDYSRQYVDNEAKFRRGALGVRLYTAADGREHQLANALLAAAMIFWAASVVSRAMQKRVQRAAVLLTVLLIAWAALRLIKWNMLLDTALARYLWFTYLPFQMAISFLLLWLSWGIHRPDEGEKLPVFLRVSAVLCGLLTLMVLTNDWHQLVYLYDLSTPGWLDVYRYGIGYYITLSFFAMQFLLAIVILMLRCVRHPRKKGFLFPALLLLLFAAYGYGYIKRIPLAYESDLVMVFAVLSIFFFEALIRSGLIPVNTKYAQFFSHSSLAIQVMDEGGQTVAASKIPLRLEERVIEEILRADEQTIQLNEDTLLCSRKIPGGFAIWRDDISKLNHLREQLADSVEKLKRTNHFLRENAKVKQEEEKARKDLTEALEAEISGKLLEIRAMIKQLAEARDPRGETAVIAMSLSLVKRRSDFFFAKQEGAFIAVTELMLCTEELSEYAALAGTEIRVINELGGELPADLADLLYGFFGEVLLYCAKSGFPRILSRMYLEERQYVMWMMLPEHEIPYEMGHRLRDEIRASGGSFDRKDLDDALGVRLSIPQRGGDQDA